jgi:serine protease Do
VVGITTLIFSRSGGSEGIGFAAPSNIVRTVYEQLRRSGRVSRGVIGVEAQTITPELAAGLRLPQSWGVILADVYPRSPAAAAGLRPGDVIAALDGKPMENARQFDVNVYGRTGEAITLDVRRGLERQSVRVRVVERGDDPRRVADLVDERRNLVAELGVLALEVDETIGEMLPWLRMRQGIAVAARAAVAPAVQTGLVSGDVIYAVNGQPVTTLAGLETALRDLPAGTPVVMHIDRRGRLRYLVFERP